MNFEVVNKLKKSLQSNLSNAFLSTLDNSEF